MWVYIIVYLATDCISLMMQSNTAIEIFKNMKLFGLSPNASTYHIMIDCCVIIRCFKSACAIVSMMVRSGFYPETMAYTILFKVYFTSIADVQNNQISDLVHKLTIFDIEVPNITSMLSLL